MSDNKAGTKRVFSSSPDESDTSVCIEREVRLREKQDNKRQHTFDMDIHDALSRIKTRFDDLATKDDFASIKRELSDLSSTFMEITALEGRLFDMEAKEEKREQELRHLKKQNETANNIIRQQDLRIKQTEKEVNDLEQYSRRSHLRVFRIPERDQETAEDCLKKVCSLFTDGVGVEVKSTNIEVAHRTGRRGSDKPRPILVRFFDRKLRDQVLINRRKLKGKGSSISEDLTAANFKLLKSAMDHSATMTAWSSGGRILAKVKNGTVVKINIHSNLDETFRRAMSPVSSMDAGADSEDKWI